jgi:hypothetical protein
MGPVGSVPATVGEGVVRRETRRKPRKNAFLYGLWSIDFILYSYYTLISVGNGIESKRKPRREGRSLEREEGSATYQLSVPPT